MADNIGIVAIGRNEGERLKRCLGSIPGDIRVVYVDSDSTDGSVAAATTAGAIVLPLDLSRPFTAARARSAGVALLQQEFPDTRRIMFIDGDCELEAGWLDTATAYLAAHSDVAVVCGRRRERFPDASLYNHVANWEWDTPIGEAASCGGDAMVRFDAYDSVGGFDSAMIAGEEPELCARLRAAGWRIMRIDAPMTIHDAAILHFGQWWKRAVRGGFGYAQAWHATSGELYSNDLTRMIIWAIVVPVLSITVALRIHPAFILGWVALIAVQLWRLNRSVGWRHGGLAIVAHYAVLIGAARYAWRLSRGRTGGALVYK